MADTKITALTAITTVDPAADVLPIVDVSDTSMAASGTTKKITSNQILGAGGTATLASATISGDLTVDTSTLKVDSANNFVGVGTTTGVNLAAGRGNLTIGGSSSAILNLSIGAADTGYVIHDGTSISLVNRIAAGSLIFSTNSTERFRIDSSGNVGIGVTPSAWAAFKAIDIGTGSSISGASSTTALGFNNYWNGSNYIYKLTAAAGDYRQTALGHAWYTAPSGTAGTAITFTQAMTLDASGNLLVGTTSSPSGTKVGAIAKLSSVSAEGTAAINVSTTPVAISRNTGVCGLFFVMGYNASGGAQGWYLVASTGSGTPTVISSGGTPGLTLTFTMAGGQLNAQTASGTFVANAFSITA